MHTSVRATSDASAGPAASLLGDRSADGADYVFAEAGTDAPDARALVVDIVERASTLRERLSPGAVAAQRNDREVAGVSIDAWRAAAARGDAETFDRRLARDGLDLTAAARAMRPVCIAPGAPLPEWATLLARYIGALDGGDGRPVEGDEQTPFVELLVPLADIVERELAAAASGALDGVSDDARRGLRAALLRRLAQLTAPILYERFDRHRTECVANRAPQLHGHDSHPALPRAIYRDFVRQMHTAGMLRLLGDLPALARAMATVAIHWRDASAELILRLRADRAAISECFANGRELGDLLSIEAGRSDPHAGGRTVHLLGFGSGLRLVYKPRGLGVDSAFMKLLDWLAIRGAPVPPPLSPTFAARVLDHGSHGWAEYVEHAGCADHSSARRYHQNAGALLALLHALGSTDCHFENIVASGERPVIVDLETVLQPEVARADPPRDRARNFGARRLYDDSALHTGLLPAWQNAGDDGAYDTGGLSATGNQVTPFTTTRWTATNTDAMRLERRRATTEPRPNLPSLTDRVVPPARHVSDIELGFSRMYEWLAAHRDEIIAPGGPLVRLAREEVRFIARPSSVYDHVLRRSLRGVVMHDGAARGVELELLARGLLQLPPELWPLLDEETRALERIDIPVFTIRGDATALVLDDRTVPVARSGLDVARERLESFSAADLELQLRIIRGSLALRYSAESSARSCRPDSVTRPPLPRGEMIAAAMEIAGDIARMALTDARGDLTWITTEPVSTAGHQRLQATGYGLYDGLAGIALFLAAASRCEGDSAATELTRRALAPIRSRLHSSPPYVEEFGIGGAAGAASAIYALTRAGLLLGDESIIADALHGARQITPASIARDTHLDVLYGSAGAILAILVLHRARRCDWLLETAVECGRLLLDTRRRIVTACGTVHHAWLTAGNKSHAGFAHGSAGIALALLRLHAATGIAECAAAAIDALRGEDAHFRGDCTSAEREAQMAIERASPRGASPLPTNWCRGTAGIGLARLTSAAGSHAAELRAGAERAVAQLLDDGVPDTGALDGACCGAMGEVELLLTAGLRWGRPALLAAAHERASRVVRRARTAGHYRTFDSAGGAVCDPALYRGMAGIGYGLLRLCHPELLPSFLSWD